MANLEKIPTALKPVLPGAVSHYEAVKKPDKYIVWAEDTEADSVWADDAQQEQAIQGTIDFFTKAEYDPLVSSIQAALSAAGISFRLNSVQRNPDTGYIHHEWIFEVDRWPS